MDQYFTPFDLKRMFIGDFPPLFFAEIIFRTAFMYLYAVLAARFMGKRGMKQLTPFELIVIIALGSAAGDPMFYPDIPLLHGVFVITVVVVLEKLLGVATRGSEKVETFLKSRPALVVKDGEVVKKTLKEENMSKDELMMQIRLQGIENLTKVEKAYLEPSGEVSIFKKNKNILKRFKTTKP